MDTSVEIVNKQGSSPSEKVVPTKVSFSCTPPLQMEVIMLHINLIIEQFPSLYRFGAEKREDWHFGFLMEQISNPQRRSHGTIQALAMACKSKCTLLEDCPFVEEKN